MSVLALFKNVRMYGLVEPSYLQFFDRFSGPIIAIIVLGSTIHSYDLDSVSNKCLENVCQCRHGIPAKGVECPTHQEEILCNSCTHDFRYLTNNNQCVAIVCLNGVPVLSQSVCGDYENISCVPCDSNYNPTASGSASTSFRFRKRKVHEIGSLKVNEFFVTEKIYREYMYEDDVLPTVHWTAHHCIKRLEPLTKKYNDVSLGFVMIYGPGHISAYPSLGDGVIENQKDDGTEHKICDGQDDGYVTIEFLEEH